MATTTNYSWSTPDDTALVKDGAAAIRSLGTAIDTTVFTNAGAAIAKATVDAKGDLIAGTADNTVARLAVGTNGHILVADSAEATGLKWAAPAAGGKVLQVVNATTTTSTSTNGNFTNATNCSATITPTSASSKILILISASIRIYRAGDYQTWAYARVRRSTTTVSPADYYFGIEIIKGGTGANVGYTGTQFFNILDTPSTTSATTYQLQIQGNVADSMYIVANPEGSTSVTLMEIGA